MRLDPVLSTASGALSDVPVVVLDLDGTIVDSGPGIFAARNVMIGDRIPDAEGASGHGVPALLVGWGYGGPVEQAAEVPRVATVAELSALLLG